MNRNHNQNRSVAVTVVFSLLTVVFAAAAYETGTHIASGGLGMAIAMLTTGGMSILCTLGAIVGRKQIIEAIVTATGYFLPSSY